MSRTLVIGIAILALASSTNEAAPPAARIVAPPDRFFQEGTALEVVVAYVSLGGGRTTLQLLVDGSELEERNVTSGRGTVTFVVQLDGGNPVSLIQVCASVGSARPDGSSCDAVRAAGTREFGLLRQTLEEMNDISDAVMRHSIMRLRYGQVAASLQDLVPDFLDHVPVESPLSTPYEYAGRDGHFVLRLALSGVGEVRNEDGAFTKLPGGAITDREAARLARQQLLDVALALESYRVDYNEYPVNIDDLFPVYRRFSITTDPYGHPTVFNLHPDTYALTGLGRDGQPGGSDFDTDTIVAPGQRITQTTPYHGRQEYARRTYLDMLSITSAISDYLERTGTLPGGLSDLPSNPWFDASRPFVDFCGNPYSYQVFDAGLGHRLYQFQAFGCDGVPGTDPSEGWLLLFSGSDEGRIWHPGALAFPSIWPGLWD